MSFPDINLALTKDPSDQKLKSNQKVAGDLSFNASISSFSAGATLTISSNTLTFFQPNSFVYIGFDRGWMQSKSDGAPFEPITVATAQGNKSIGYEYGLGQENRFVYTTGGKKWLRSLLYPGGNNAANKIAGGVINYDSGGEILPGVCAMMYGVKRITKTRPEDAAAFFQLKMERIGQSPTLSTANEIYLKQSGGSNAPAITAYEGDEALGAKTYQITACPVSDGIITQHALLWKMNTPDISDGSVIALTAKSGSYTRSVPNNGGTNPTGVIKSNDVQRPRCLKEQMFLGNNDNAAQDIEALATDYYWQVGGSKFFLVDNVDPALRSYFVPLIPKSFNSSSSWTFDVYQGFMPNLNSLGVIMIDDAGNEIKKVQF